MTTAQPEAVLSAARVRSRVSLQRLPLAALLGLTAFLYLWGLSRNGYANEFYSAAVKAGTQSWKAFLFGSLDPSNFITVDKPPASLWVMELSGRVFGFSSWSMLVPQALEGVAAVWLLYATVRRWFSQRAALLSGAICSASFTIVLIALQSAGAGAVITLRNASVVFALGCAYAIGERPGFRITGEPADEHHFVEVIHG